MDEPLENEQAMDASNTKENVRSLQLTGGLPFEIKAPNAATQAAMLGARQVRARYATAKDLFDDLEGKRPKTKKKRSHKKV